MDLILWRHAEAEEGFDDLGRVLTPKGHRQAAQTAHWLRARLPRDCRIWVSPAVRAQQTVAALDLPYETVDAIAPGAMSERVLTLLGDINAPDARLLVGHQPTLGLVAGTVLLGLPRDLMLTKSGVIWLEITQCEDRIVGTLKAAITASLI